MGKVLVEITRLDTDNDPDNDQQRQRNELGAGKEELHDLSVTDAARVQKGQEQDAYRPNHVHVGYRYIAKLVTANTDFFEGIERREQLREENTGEFPESYADRGDHAGLDDGKG